MSSFVVDKTHIDALVTAGLRLATSGGPLRWFDRRPSDEAYERGSAIPAGSIAWAEAHRREHS